MGEGAAIGRSACGVCAIHAYHRFGVDQETRHGWWHAGFLRVAEAGLAGRQRRPGADHQRLMGLQKRVTRFPPVMARDSLSATPHKRCDMPSYGLGGDDNVQFYR